MTCRNPTTQEEMIRLIKEDVTKHGFQAVAFKDIYGRQGIGWTLSTCASNCAISPGCFLCPVYLLSRKEGGKRPAYFLTDNLLKPMSLQRPRVIFVCPQGDLFHKDIPLQAVAQVLAVIEANPDHCFVLLTKRAREMAEMLCSPALAKAVVEEGSYLFGDSFLLRAEWGDNILAGVSVEDQKRMDERSKYLLELPTTMMRVIFASPMLEGLRIPTPVKDELHWMVQNRERGSTYARPRPCKLEWVHDLKQQCDEAGIPFFTQDRHTKKLVATLGKGTRCFPRHPFFQMAV